MRLLPIHASVGLASGLVAAAPRPEVDLQTRQSAPNPIAALYPNSITGTANSTIAVVPIDYAVARRIVPRQWGILENAYLELLPGFPANKYPLIIRFGIEHGDTIFNYHEALPDWQCVHIDFPFVDILNDGYSSFIYNPAFILSAFNTVGIQSTEAYGTIPVPATFNPNVPNAYGLSATGKIEMAAYNATSGSALVATSFVPMASLSPWPLNFYVNVTNQPSTGNGKLCNNQIDLWNTTLSEGPNAPVGIQGSVTLSDPMVAGSYTFDGVYGVKVDVAFVENVMVPCDILKGYRGTGSGD